jgi:hypothetical protein
MSATDESENLLDYLTKRIKHNGRRVTGNPTRQSNPEADSRQKPSKPRANREARSRPLLPASPKRRARRGK